MEMDHQSDHQKQHDHHHRYYYYYNFLSGGGGNNNTMQFVMISSSLCAFCLLFVWFSFCGTGFCSLPQYDCSSFINVYFFTIITRTLQRKYMFLICNAILAFLAKFSSFSSTPSISSPAFNNLDLHPSDLPHTKPLPSENATLMLQQVLQPQQEHVGEEEEKPDLEQEDHEQVLLDAEEAKINETSVAHHHRQEQQEEEEEEEEEDDDDDEDEENNKMLVMATNEELVNTEELNRKFEEFIRRMKEEIRIEAQTQLIAV